MLVVAAMLKVVDGKGDELEQEVNKLVPKVLEEPGVITYLVHRSIDNPSRFFVYEKYKSSEDFVCHCATPHFKKFSEAFELMKDGEPEIELYNEIAGKA